MKISLPLKLFPESQDAQHQLLSNYFPGKDYLVEYSGQSVDVLLKWPQDSTYYIDKNLEIGLKWWGQNLNIGEIPVAIAQKPNFQLSLNDNWTLYSWSKWLDGKVQNGESIDKVIILHIDDHRDCMSPLLFLKEKNIYVDPLTNQKISIEDPGSISSAIKSGAISVGSFMPIFFHHVSNIEFRHLLPSYRMPTAYRAGGIQIGFEKDQLLCNQCDRPNMRFEESGKSPHFYHPTDDLDIFLAGITKDVPVLLHVDMDYFNNRFDGDSDWRLHNHIHDPDRENVLSCISEIFERIIKFIPASQMQDVSIALSPGFFPAEFWEDAISLICLKFEEMYDK